MRRLTVFFILGILLVGTFGIVYAQSGTQLAGAITGQGLQLAGAPSIINQALGVSVCAATAGGGCLISAATDIAISQLVKTLPPEFQAAAQLYGTVKPLLDSGGANVEQDIEITESGEVTKGVLDVEAGEEADISTFVNEEFEEGTINLVGGKLEVKGDVATITFDDEGASLDTGGIIFKNIEPGGEISIGKQGDVLSAEFVVDENGGKYDFNGEFIEAPPGSNIKYSTDPFTKENKLEVTLPEGGKLNSMPTTDDALIELKSVNDKAFYDLPEDFSLEGIENANGRILIDSEGAYIPDGEAVVFNNGELQVHANAEDIRLISEIKSGESNFFIEDNQVLASGIMEVVYTNNAGEVAIDLNGGSTRFFMDDNRFFATAVAHDNGNLFYSLDGKNFYTDGNVITESPFGTVIEDFNGDYRVDFYDDGLQQIGSLAPDPPEPPVDLSWVPEENFFRGEVIDNPYSKLTMENLDFPDTKLKTFDQPYDHLFEGIRGDLDPMRISRGRVLEGPLNQFDLGSVDKFALDNQISNDIIYPEDWRVLDQILEDVEKNGKVDLDEYGSALHSAAENGDFSDEFNFDEHFNEVTLIASKNAPEASSMDYLFRPDPENFPDLWALQDDASRELGIIELNPELFPELYPTKVSVENVPAAEITEPFPVSQENLPGFKFNGVRVLGGEARITSSYGTRNDPFTGRLQYHSGVDIAAKAGTKVYPFKDGKITYSGWKGGYGRVVVIEHKDGLESTYAHNSKNLLQVGDVVKEGITPIALVGSSGRSTGPHIHFEIRKNGKAIDPSSIK